MSADILEKLYYLRSHPFGDMYEAPLDPRTNPAHVSCYFDLYDWERSPLLQKVSPTKGLAIFPDDKAFANSGSMLLLIAGSNQTGRESLRNLILHKVAQDTPAPDKPPIVTELELEEGDRAEAIRQIAETFMYTYSDINGETKPARADLEKILEKATATRSTSDQSYYAATFQLWRQLTRPHCRKPLVLAVRGVYLYNTLRVVFNSTRHLFKFVIVTTDDPSNAESCRKLLADEKRNVGLIESIKLDRAKAAEYVYSRLFAERLKGSPYDARSLVPFSGEALDALYDEGPTLGPGENITWHVEFLYRTLRLALDAQLAALEARKQRDGIDALQHLALKDRIIGAEQIRQACKAIHKT